MNRKYGGGLRRMLLKIYYGYSLCLGMASYWHDNASGTYKQSRYKRFVALLINVLTVALLPWVTIDSLHIMGLVQWNSLMVLVNIMNASVRALAILYTVVYRYKREQQIYALLSAVHRLERLHLSGVRPNEVVERRLNRVFCLQYAAMTYLYMALVGSFFMVANRWKEFSIVLSAIYALMQNILYVTVFQYFLAVWYICRCLCYVNLLLQEMLLQLHEVEAYRHGHTTYGTLHARTAQLCGDLEQVLRLHWQLRRIVRQLQHVFSFQMLAIRCSFLMWYVLTGYFCVVIVSTLKTTPFMRFFAVLSFTMMTLEIYFVDLICHMTMQYADETSYILRGFSEYQLWSRRLRNTLSSWKLRINLWGLFQTDKSHWFSMIASVIGYIIVLLQFHLVLDNSGAVNVEL